MRPLLALACAFLSGAAFVLALWRRSEARRIDNERR